MSCNVEVRGPHPGPQPEPTECPICREPITAPPRPIYLTEIAVPSEPGTRVWLVLR